MLLPSMCLFYSSHRIIFPFIEKGLIYGRRSTKEILLFEDELPVDQPPPLAIFLFLFKTLLTLLFSTAPHPPGDLKCKLSCFMAFPRAVYVSSASCTVRCYLSPHSPALGVLSQCSLQCLGVGAIPGLG